MNKNQKSHPVITEFGVELIPVVDFYDVEFSTFKAKKFFFEVSYAISL